MGQRVVGRDFKRLKIRPISWLKARPERPLPCLRGERRLTGQPFGLKVPGRLQGLEVSDHDHDRCIKVFARNAVGR
jgi:hypothetical protein